MYSIDEIYSPSVLEDITVNFKQEHWNVIWTRKHKDFALRDPWIEEMEESASHHLFIICFALLRAETAENHAGEARRWPQIMKNLIFRTPKNMQHSI